MHAPGTVHDDLTSTRVTDLVVAVGHAPPPSETSTFKLTLIVLTIAIYGIEFQSKQLISLLKTRIIIFDEDTTI